jgi:hypothetical protein
MIGLIAHPEPARERNADLPRAASPLVRDPRPARAGSRGLGKDLSHQRFHSALLALGSPPLGLMETVPERG